ncbi:vitellin-degrading protease-like [Leptopilina boulardi]|uniref:vitellin-degrading protease-like n=1 Tax=Leptopilina boulardi TaxID=63433 RepID=UPI0021F5B98F|nr:vitellin-degrading protease-like [Leptopilina boulardi]
MFKFLCFVSFFVLASASPFLRLDGKIVGGDEIDITNAPYQVSLYMRGNFFCGGSIISENYILTAGHCSRYNTDAYTIRAGSSYIYKNGSEHNVIEVINHENFGTIDGILANDIALMKVDPPFQLDATRQTIKLMGKGKTLAAGLNGLVSGWGRLTEGGLAPRKLQGVIVPLISKKSCQQQYSFMGRIPDGQICAALPQGGKDACQGDSGGPYVVGNSLAGIVSWGVGCARPKMPGVYTEVSHYRDWIEKHSGL